MFVSSVFVYIYFMMSISIGNQLIKFALLDTEKLERLGKKAKKIKKEENYDQIKYVKTMQASKDINFELIYIQIITLICMFTCLIWIERTYPITILGHKLGFFGILCLIITEGYVLKVILGKLGIK